uniref:fluoride efflux transporter FluC n=1 Tax=Nocardia donostiensis TaxID=1538463 RepID=UPI003183D000
MVLSTEVWVANRLLRPLLGVGVLGGFTTYSAETRTLLDSGAVGETLAYLGGNHGGMSERCRARDRPGARGNGQGAVDNMNGMTERVAGQ